MSLILNSNRELLPEVKTPSTVKTPQPAAVTSFPSEIAPKGLATSIKDLKDTHTFTMAERTDPNMQKIIMFVSKFDNIFDNISLPEGLCKEKFKKIIELVRIATNETINQVLVPPDLPPSKPTNVLHHMNVQLEGLSRQLIYLSEAIDMPSNSSEVPYYKAFSNVILKHYWILLDDKTAFVKMHFPENPAYAMAVPVTLPAGSIWYSCGSSEKMRKLFIEGFESHINLEREAVIIGELDMGENGVYFSSEIPTYIYENRPLGFKILLTQPLHGFSIKSVTELYMSGKDSGFTLPQIEEAYKKLIRISNFIQHDGPTISRTEVVFLRSQGVVQPTGIVTLQNDIPSPTKEYPETPIREYLESFQTDHTPLTQHHSFSTN